MGLISIRNGLQIKQVICGMSQESPLNYFPNLAPVHVNDLFCPQGLDWFLQM